MGPATAAAKANRTRKRWLRSSGGRPFLEREAVEPQADARRLAETAHHPVSQRGGVGRQAAGIEEMIAAMDAEERGALIGMMEGEGTKDEPGAEEKRAQAEVAGSETAGDSRTDDLCGRRVCIPQELLETIRSNLRLKDGGRPEARVQPGRLKAP